jgi:hypothetical protein
MPQTQTSSNSKISSSERRASRERFPTSNAASVKSKAVIAREGRTAKPTCMALSSTASTKPVSMSGWPPFVRTVTFKTVLDFFQLPSLRNASFEEAMFLHILYSSLANQAEMLAAILPWSVQRPLQALFSTMSVPAQNCNVQSAKRKRPSSSSASSRKRSSSA